mgnify:CR=1 FL=1
MGDTISSIISLYIATDFDYRGQPIPIRREHNDGSLEDISEMPPPITDGDYRIGDFGYRMIINTDAKKERLTLIAPDKRITIFDYFIQENGGSAHKTLLDNAWYNIGRMLMEATGAPLISPSENHKPLESQKMQ